MGLLPLWCHVVVCVSVCVCACNRLKLETTAQLTHVGKSIWHVLRKQLHIFCQAILLSYRTSKKAPRSDLTNTGTQHAANMSMRGVSSMWETPPSYQRQVGTWLNQTNPVKLGVLRVLWQFKNYSTIQNHWEPKRAENTVKKIKKTKLWATCDYLPSLFAFCSLFLWGFAGGPPGPDPKGFLQYTSPIYWSWVPACDMWN